jgi:hypothetical protein
MVRRRPRQSVGTGRTSKSLKLIERAAPDFSASISDVGGGESTVVDDLLAHGYKNVTVLDVSQTAIDLSKKRLGKASNTSSGSSPILRKPSWRPALTMYGTTVQYSIS